MNEFEFESVYAAMNRRRKPQPDDIDRQLLRFCSQWRTLKEVEDHLCRTRTATFRRVLSLQNQKRLELSRIRRKQRGSSWAWQIKAR